MKKDFDCHEEISGKVIFPVYSKNTFLYLPDYFFPHAIKSMKF